MLIGCVLVSTKMLSDFDAPSVQRPQIGEAFSSYTCYQSNDEGKKKERKKGGVRGEGA